MFSFNRPYSAKSPFPSADLAMQDLATPPASMMAENGE
jgi:hypothetical protein